MGFFPKKSRFHRIRIYFYLGINLIALDSTFAQQPKHENPWLAKTFKCFDQLQEVMKRECRGLTLSAIHDPKQKFNQVTQKVASPSSAYATEQLVFTRTESKRTKESDPLSEKGNFAQVFLTLAPNSSDSSQQKIEGIYCRSSSWKMTVKEELFHQVFDPEKESFEKKLKIPTEFYANCRLPEKYNPLPDVTANAINRKKNPVKSAASTSGNSI